MGRFASTVEFYSRYREPYPAKFFATVAQQLAFTGQEALLDVGCGPGILAIGFAPFVKTVTGLDPEPAMLAEAKAAAKSAGVTASFIQGCIEEFEPGKTFDIVTMGRALHWFDRDATISVLERMVRQSGRILVCGASSAQTPSTPWVKPYESVRRSWAADPDQKCYRIDSKSWFAGSSFHESGEVSVAEDYQVTIDDLIGRALSRSNTSPAVVGEGRAAFEAEIAEALKAFLRDGVLHDQIVARASCFTRTP